MSKVYIVTKATSFDSEIVGWAPTGIFKTMEAANVYIDREVSAYKKGETKINGEDFVASRIDRSETGAMISGESIDWYCKVIMSIHELEYTE